MLNWGAGQWEGELTLTSLKNIPIHKIFNTLDFFVAGLELCFIVIIDGEQLMVMVYKYRRAMVSQLKGI